MRFAPRLRIGGQRPARSRQGTSRGLEGAGDLHLHPRPGGGHRDLDALTAEALCDGHGRSGGLPAAARPAALSRPGWPPRPAPVTSTTPTIIPTTGSTIAVSAVADPRSSPRRDDRADRGITPPSTGPR